jgi:META domain
VPAGDCEAPVRRRTGLTVLGLTIVVGLGMVAIQFTSRPSSTAPPHGPAVAPGVAWAPERFGQDWPAPVRVEPARGHVPVVQMHLGEDARWDPSDALWGPSVFGDRLADGVPGELPWLDIREVRGSSGSRFSVSLAGAGPSPRPAPPDAWVAYGLVLDTDSDGRADVRIGMDNMAGDEHRAWWADLKRGEVSWAAGRPYGDVGGDAEGQRGGPWIVLDTWYPGESFSEPDVARFMVWPAVEDLRFYAWSSLIEGGRVVATDYAPDVAWLEPGTQPALTFAAPVWWRETDVQLRANVHRVVIQTLTVTPDGRLGINAACRAGTASLVIGTDTLKVSKVSLVETRCEPDDAEIDEGLLEILSAGTIEYTIDAGILELRAGSRHIEFSARFQGPPR